MTTTPNLLDRTIPSWHFQERHSRVIPTSPADAYAALLALTPREVPLLCVFAVIRDIPARLTGKTRSAADLDRPLLDLMTAGSFLLLGTDSTSEIAVGMAGELWRPVYDAPKFDDPEAFTDFDEPGNAKGVMHFLVEPHETGCRVVTETRVVATDAAARRKFARYWWTVARPFGGFMRHPWLRAIERRAVARSAAV